MVLKFIDIVFSFVVLPLPGKQRSSNRVTNMPTEAPATIDGGNPRGKGSGDLVEEAADKLPEVPTRVINQG